MGSGNPFIGNGANVGSIARALNDFYSYFVKIAVIVYMIVLLYIGISILLTSASEKSAKYKEYILYWLQGIVLLFFFPYVMKYTIVINNTFVQYIYDTKTGNANMPQTPSAAGGMAGLDSGLKATMDTLLKGSDYMSQMFKNGWEQGWMLYGICFLVMVLQTLILLVMYFKRLLIVIFLIACFPFVMIFYAVDKLKDGKSQTFSNWCKEFTLNVFVNSFHAIVYVIGMAMILALGSNLAKNWLLVLILLSFISKGDEMLRGIFNMGGGGGKTVNSIGKSIAKAKTITGAIATGRAIASGLFGKNSLIGKATKAGGKVREASLDRTLARQEKASAEYNNLMASRTEETAQSTQSSQSERLDAPQTGSEAANAALSAESSEEDRNAALDQILNAMNSKDEAFMVEVVSDLSDEETESLQQMLQARAAANAIAAGGLTEVQLNQNIEILLKCMRNKGSRSASVAERFAGNEKNLEALALGSKMKFKKPTASSEILDKNFSDKRDKVKKGSRYGGRYRQSVAAQKMEQARNALAEKEKPVDNSLRGKIVAAGAGAVGAKRRFTRGVRTARARVDIARRELGALNETRDLLRLQRQLRNMKKNGGAGGKDYADLEARINKMNNSGSIADLRNRRKGYAERGIYFSSTGINHDLLSGNTYYARTKNNVKNRVSTATRTVKQTAERYRPSKIKAAAKDKINTGRLYVREQVDQARSAKKIMELRRGSRNKTDAERVNTEREIQKIKDARKKQTDELRAKGISLRPSLVEHMAAKDARSAGKREERDAMKTLFAAELKSLRNGGVIQDPDGKVKSAENLLKSRLVIERPLKLSKVGEKIDDVAHVGDRIKEWGKERADAKQEWNDLKSSNTYDSLANARKDVKSAQNELEAARNMIKAAGGDPVKLQEAKNAEDAALKKLQDANATQMAVSQKIKDARNNAKDKGVILTGFSKLDKEQKKADKNFEKQLKDANSEERALEKKNAKSRAHAEEAEALKNTIELVDLRKMAKDKEVARQAKKEANTLSEDSVTARIKKYQDETAAGQAVLDSVANQRAILQQSARENGMSTTYKPGLQERLVNAVNSAVDAPRAAVDLASKAERTALDMAMKSEDILKSIPSVPGEVVSTIREMPGQVVSAAKKTFGKNEEGLSLAKEIIQMANKKEESKQVITGIYSEPEVKQHQVPEGIYPTTSSETIVVVGNDKVDKKGKFVVPLSSSSDEVMAKQNYEDAKKAAEASFASNPDNDGSTKAKLSPAQEDALYQLSCCVVGLNDVEKGVYTASEVVSQVETFKRLESAFTPGTSGYDEFQALKDGLKYDVSDIEANLRIQIINDPSLIASNDPRKDKIQNDSVSYVVDKMDADDLLLSTLKYKQEDLSDGKIPFAGNVTKEEAYSKLASQGILSASEESAILESYTLLTEQEARLQRIADADAALAKAQNELVSSSIELVGAVASATVDLAVTIPASAATGFMMMGAAGEVDTSVAAGLSGYSLGNKVVGGVTSFGGKIAHEVTSPLTSKFGKALSEHQAEQKVTNQKSNFEEYRQQKLAERQESYKNLTSVPEAGAEGSLEYYKNKSKKGTE